MKMKTLKHLHKILVIKQLDEFEKLLCDQEINLEDIENAVKELNKGSSPGMDGLPSEFYQTFFEDIKFLLFDYYKECFDKGELSETSQIGIISLSHKGKSLERDVLTNWRPITLTNTDYKIIAKIFKCFPFISLRQA